MTTPTRFSRRDFLNQNAMGIGAVALAWLLKQDRLLGIAEEASEAEGACRSFAA